MIIFATRSTEHSARHIALPHGNRIIKQFSDGELYLKIEKPANDETVWILTSTESPAEHLLELFLLLDALKRSGIRSIHIFFTYFGYARQAVAAPGEACSPQVISEILQLFPLGRIFILHAHAAPLIHAWLPFENVINLDFFCSIAQDYDCVAAPDKGAQQFAEQVAHVCKKDIIYLEKTRPAHEQVRITFVDGKARDKKILLIDDIIATGSTMIAAAQALKDLGALKISAAATHGIFSGDAHKKIADSILTRVYVTNSIQQKPNAHLSVVDIAPFIQKTMSSGTTSK